MDIINDNKSVVVYTYRYMWLLEDSENLNMHILTGTEHNHNDFIEQLKKAEKIKHVCRVYVNEIDLAKLEEYETIEINKKEDIDNA